MTGDPRPGGTGPAPWLLDELAELRRKHADLRLRYANLLAAARATLHAAHEGEPDALAYLTDELTAGHGQHDLPPVVWSGGQWVVG